MQNTLLPPSHHFYGSELQGYMVNVARRLRVVLKLLSALFYLSTRKIAFCVVRVDFRLCLRPRKGFQTVDAFVARAHMEEMASQEFLASTRAAFAMCPSLGVRSVMAVSAHWCFHDGHCLPSSSSRTSPPVVPAATCISLFDSTPHALTPSLARPLPRR